MSDSWTVLTALRAVGEGHVSSSLSRFRFGNGGFQWGGNMAGSSSCKTNQHWLYASEIASMRNLYGSSIILRNQNLSSFNDTFLIFLMFSKINEFYYWCFTKKKLWWRHYMYHCVDCITTILDIKCFRLPRMDRFCWRFLSKLSHKHRHPRTW